MLFLKNNYLYKNLKEIIKTSETKEEVMENIKRAKELSPLYVVKGKFTLKPSLFSDNVINLYFYKEENNTKLCPFHFIHIDNHMHVFAYQLVPKFDYFTLTIEKDDLQKISPSDGVNEYILNCFYSDKNCKKPIHLIENNSLEFFNYYNKIVATFVKNDRALPLNHVNFLLSIKYLFLPYIKCNIYSLDLLKDLCEAYKKLPQHGTGGIIIAGNVFAMPFYDKILFSNRISIPKWLRYSDNFEFEEVDKCKFNDYILHFDNPVYKIKTDYNINQTFFITNQRTHFRVYNNIHVSKLFNFSGLLRIEMRN